MTYLIVFMGAGLGGALRHGVNIACVRLFGIGFPWGTLTVNIVGSIVMGLFAGWFALRGHGNQELRLFLTTGLLGGFTTFSTFSLDAVALWERGRTWAAFLYTFGSVAAGFAGLALALFLMRRFA